MCGYWGKLLLRGFFGSMHSSTSSRRAGPKANTKYSQHHEKKTAILWARFGVATFEFLTKTLHSLKWYDYGTARIALSLQTIVILVRNDQERREVVVDQQISQSVVYGIDFSTALYGNSLARIVQPQFWVSNTELRVADCDGVVGL